MKSGFVYILANKPNGTLYVGVTSALEQRTHKHRIGFYAGFTRRYGVKRLVYFEEHPTMASAINREKQLKRWKRQWKLELVREHNPEWVDLYEGLTP